MSVIREFEQFDADGALAETGGELDGSTRASFFKKAAVGAGAVLSAGAITAMLPELATAAKPSAEQDLVILNYALVLEYLEAAFYKEASSNGGLSGDVLQLAKLINDHEQTHVTVLRRTIKSLHGKPVLEPKFDFQGTTQDQVKFLTTAFTLENTGVRAYLGQVGNLKSKALLAAAASIVTVEARHASAVAALLGQTPFDAGTKSITPSGAFDKSSTTNATVAAVKKTGFITSATGFAPARGSTKL